MTLYGAAVLLVIFGALLAALDLLLLALTSRILVRLERTAPGPRSEGILLARSAPVLTAAVVALLVFLPAWWVHEPPDTGEAASPVLLGLAMLSALPLLQGLYRGARMFVKTRDRLVTWRASGRKAPRAEAPFEVLEVASEDLGLCVGGYLRPTIYASAAVMRSLEPGELTAALAHETGHAVRRDPLRLLWLGCCPDFLRLFGLDGPWRLAFTRACEFAADEGASRGDQEVALDLASALLKVARLRTFRPSSVEALSDVAVSSAFANSVELEARVGALVNPGPEPTRAGSSLRPWMFPAALALLCAAGLVASAPVHALAEAVGRILTR
jgi:hypothetical protein